MTANLKRWDPSGADGATVTTSGTPLNTVTVSGTNTVKYELDAGMSRGSEIGVEIRTVTDVDTANVLMTATSTTAASAQVYFKIIQLPTSGTGVVPFFYIRNSSTTAIRAALSPAGVLTCQNTAGAAPPGGLSGTLATLSTATVYRLELDVDPGVGTTDGFGALALYSDTDTVLVNRATATTSVGNFGTTNPDRVQFGDQTTTAGSPTGLIIQFTQLAIDTAATVPSIAAVAKNGTSASPYNYPRVLDTGVWR